MTTLMYLLVAVAMLVVTGWWIAREIAKDARAAFGPPVQVVADAALHEPLCRGLERCGIARYRVRIADAMDDPSGLQEPVSRVAVVRVGRDYTVTCVRLPSHPGSFALQRVSFVEGDAKRAWAQVAELLICQHDMGRNQAVGGIGDASRGWSGFERRYLSAWRRLRSNDQSELRVARSELRQALVHWPSNRISEKAIALANLADLTNRLPEGPDVRLARTLEGYDAAREALLLQSSMPRECRLTGLRGLVRKLGGDIASPRTMRGSTPSNASHVRRDHRTPVVQRGTRLHGQTH